MKAGLHTIIGATIFGLTLSFPAGAALTTNSWAPPGTNKWEAAGNWTAGLPSTNSAVNVISIAGINLATIDLATTTNAGGSAMTISNLILGPLGISNIVSMANAGTGTPLRIINGCTLN